MQALLAVDNESLERFIGELNEIDVVKTVRNKKTLVENVKLLNPEIVIISHLLSGEEKIQNLVYQIVNFPEFTGRIIYLYGPDDSKRKAYCNFLIQNKVYDFHYSDLNADTLLDLVFNAKKESDVQYEDVEEKIEVDTINEEEYLSTSKTKVSSELVEVRTEIQNNNAEKQSGEKKGDKVATIAKEERLDSLGIIEKEIEKEQKKDKQSQLKVEIKFVEKIVEVEKEVIKEVFIEKKQVVTEYIEKEVIDNGIIALIGAQGVGKSTLSKILAQNFADRDYRTTLLNFDQNNSANFLFDMGEEFQDFLEKVISENTYKEILENCYNPTENLKVISGKKLEPNNLSEEEFDKLYKIVRSKSDITIIDCDNKVNFITREAVARANVTLLVFDLNCMNIELNCKIINELGDVFSPEKTIIVINNVYKSNKLRHIKRLLENLDYNFKDIVEIQNCGGTVYDTMLTPYTPYNCNNANILFKDDIDLLIDSLKGRKKKEEGNHSRVLEKIWDAFFYVMALIGEFSISLVKNPLTWILIAAGAAYIYFTKSK